MAHLIQPVSIDSTLYCVDEQGNMRTERIFTGDAYAETEATAVIAFVPGGGYGTMKFGTSCAGAVTIALTSDGLAVDFVTWEVHLNGVLVDSGTVSGAEVDVSVPVTMTPSPCGNVIEVVVGLSHDGSAIIGSAIIF